MIPLREKYGQKDGKKAKTIINMKYEMKGAAVRLNVWPKDGKKDNSIAIMVHKWNESMSVVCINLL